MMDEDAVTGVTSNPTIFQKALSQGDAYDEDLKKLLAETDDPTEIFFSLALQDIRDACDVLRPAYDASGGIDGYVSMEVEPGLAYDTERTFEQARWIAHGGRPAEPLREDPGDGARAAGDRGLHRARHVDQHHADLLARPLQGRRRGVPPRARAARRRRRRPVEGRVGRVVLRLARRHRGRQAPRGRRASRRCKGKLAIANAKLAYKHFLEAFSGPRWEYLAGKGANKQRCLWASTSTKNPAYRDVIYVEELIGPDTVNTMPLETIGAFQDHGEVRGDTVLEGRRRRPSELLGEARRGRRRLRRRHRSRSRPKGVQKFADSFDEIVESIRAKRGSLAAA